MDRGFAKWVRDRFGFGVDLRHRHTGADIYVWMFQLCSLLPLPFMFTAAAHPAIFGSRGAFSVMFRIGMSAVPRVEMLALSCMYRQSGSEVAVYFILIAVALALGIIMNRLLRDSYDRPGTGLKTRKALRAAIALDLVIRLIPVSANLAFGLPAAASGFVIRALCLALVQLDLRAAGGKDAEGAGAQEGTI